MARGEDSLDTSSRTLNPLLSLSLSLSVRTAPKESQQCEEESKCFPYTQICVRPIGASSAAVVSYIFIVKRIVSGEFKLTDGNYENIKQCVQAKKDIPFDI